MCMLCQTGAVLVMFILSTGKSICQDLVVGRTNSHIECGLALHVRVTFLFTSARRLKVNSMIEEFREKGCYHVVIRCNTSTP